MDVITYPWQQISINITTMHVEVAKRITTLEAFIETVIGFGGPNFESSSRLQKPKSTTNYHWNQFLSVYCRNLSSY